MAFQVPSMPLLANQWLRYGSTTSLPPGRPADVANIPCQLYVPRSSPPAPTLPNTSGVAFLLVPKGTDIRGSAAGGQLPDLLEVPAGSGRFYTVRWVDDRSKGFPNEYRMVCMLQQVQIAGGWRFPTP
jgi:hypothetical protein